MAEGAADRDVVFRLSAESSPETPKVLKHHGDAFAEAQRKITQYEQAQSRVRQAGVVRESESYTATWDRSFRDRESAFKAHQARLQAMAKNRLPDVVMPQISTPDADPSPGRSGRQADPVAREQQIQERKAAIRRKAESDHANAFSKALAKMDKENERAERKRLVDAKKFRGLALKEIERQDKEAARSAAKAQKEREQAIKRTEAAFSKATEEREAATRRLNDSGLQALEGVIKIGEGFAVLGLASEETTEKIIKGFMKVKGAADMARGMIEVWRGVSEAVRAFQAISTAAQTAELAARQANIAAINGEVAALGRKSAANITASATGAAGSAASTVAGGAAGAAGAVGKATVWGYLGTKALGAAKGIGAIALTATKVAGVALAATEGLNAVRRSLGDVSDSAESPTMAFLSWRKAAAAAARSTEELTKAEGRRQAALDMGARRAARVQAEAENARKLAALDRNRDAQRRETQAMNRGLTGEQRDAFISRRQQQQAVGDVWSTQQELNRSREALQDARQRSDMGGAIEAEARIEEARKNAVAASNRMLEATRERQRAEEQIARTRVQAADEAIAKAKQELEQRRNMLKSERDHLRSAQERFGAMSRSEQRELIRIKSKADAGGTLTVAEAGKLSSLGTKDAQGIASRLYRERAEQAGFGKHFGAAEREEISRIQREARSMEIKLQDARDFKVKVERDDASLARRLANTVSRELEARDELLRKDFSEELDRKVAEINSRNERRELAREQSR